MADQVLDGFLRDSASRALVVLGANGTQAGAQGELGYAQITADATRLGTTYVDVAGLSVTVTVGSRPIMVIFDCGGLINDTASGGVSVALLEDGVIIGSNGQLLATANNSTPGHRELRRSPTPGAHTYKIQLKSALAGTAAIKADAGATYGPASIQVIES